MPFKKFRVNLTKLQPRPLKRQPWEYYFFADFEGHVDEPRVQKTLDALNHEVGYLRVLGSFPAAAPVQRA